MKDVLNLPIGWVEVTVADIGKVVSGGTPSTKESSYWGGDISWISPSDLTGYANKYISKGFKSITQQGLENSSATLMPAGSIHFSSRAPIGYTVISSCDITTNQGFKSLVPAKGIFNEYIYFYFTSAKQLAESKATGTTFKEISGSAFSKLPVPLPPTNEQYRIVAKIEELFSELDKGIENLKIAQTQLKVYRQALLKHAFEGKLTAQWRKENQDKLEPTDVLLQRIQKERTARYQQQLVDWEAAGKQGSKPKAPKPLPQLTAEELTELPELPEGWGWVRLEALVTGIDQGWSPKCENHPASESRWGVIKTTAIQHGRFHSYENKAIPIGMEPRSQHEIRVGDILITRAGPRVRVGVCCLVRSVRNRLMNCDKAYRIRADETLCSPAYLEGILNSPGILDVIERIKSGINDSGLNLNQGAFLRLLVPLCGTGEQAEVISLVEKNLSEVDQLEQTIGTALQQAETLRQSILKKAFSGQLVPQDSSDEPAAVLLERIQAEKSKLVSAKPTRKKAPSNRGHKTIGKEVL